MKNYLNQRCLVTLAFLISFLSACKQKTGNRMFTSLDAETSGIHFRNIINDNDSSYSFINEFGYMGGGVGIGDFNNDGLKDIFFTGNQVSCRLYINKGNNQFADITANTGIKTTDWCTGVSIADINQDGYDDIYVCVFGKDLMQRSRNLLFINQHNLTFTESAAAYGLDDSGYSTQAAFLDYDRDGDLDMYLVNYLLSTRNSNTIFPRDRSGFSPANDKLYRNDGDSVRRGHPFFKDVSLQAGIKEDGYGLGVAVSDYNNDGWPDIYVANDFLSNDELWLNNKKGGFTNCISLSLQHQSYSSMGADAADINNDMLTDIVTLDMLPEYNERRKTSFSFMNYERYESERAMGYEPEFMRNMLQLNNGSRFSGDTSIPLFSETGRLAGIDATDWSWSVLLADFNNDGWKDMHITNGIGRDFINADFLEFSSNIFSSTQSSVEKQKAIRKKLASLDNVNLPNYLYLNNRDLTFSDQSADAGINEPSMSNGAAYADLDNDGDLDIVVNNIGKEAFVFVNNTIQKNKPAVAHYLSIGLQGSSLNKKGFGAKVIVYNNGKAQVQEENPVRGYFSSVDQQLIFGLGEDDHADSIWIIWPDEKKQLLKNVKADSSYLISWKNAGTFTETAVEQLELLFTEITGSASLAFHHQDNIFNDYNVQRLLPQKYSQLGPFITAGDINSDGATDFFIGGAFSFSGNLFTQNSGLAFTATRLTDSIKLEEDMDCILFDADKDGDSDLLVTGGDIQYGDNAIQYKPRLYLNNGKGSFKLQPDALPDSVRTIAGCVTAGDYDGDGDDDLFIGGRVAAIYPLPAKSFLLQNNQGIFTDVTEKVCPALQKPGMVTAAVWADFNNDHQTDLIVTGEWMAVRFFKNDHGHLTDVTTTTGLTQINGMWRSLIASDIDKDGDMDLVAGNLGLNCEYRVSATEPMELFGEDLDGNGSIDPLFCYYIKAADGNRYSFPAISRSRLAEQVPAIKKQFLLNEAYSHASAQDIVKGKAADKLFRLYCDETHTCYFENTGNGKFIKHPLPVEAQLSPVNAIVCDDLDNDGFKDLILAGNEYQADVMTGRYDASYGCFLRGSSNKSFINVPLHNSGFVLNGDVKDLSLIRLASGDKILLAAVNNDWMKVFRIKPPTKAGSRF
jgi:enediyne biosynthesis protein E4